MRESVIFYKSFYEAISELSIEQQAHIYNAIFDYQFNDNEPVLDNGIEMAVWKIIKPLLMANNERFENGKKGGRPFKKNNLEQPSNNLDITQQEPEVIEKETIGFENENHRLSKSAKNKNLMSNVVMSNELCIMNNAVEEVKEETTASAATNFYLENINPVASQFELEQIQDYEQDLPPDLIIYAMQIAIEQRKTTLRYIKGILRSWKSKGIVCLKQALEENNKKQQAQSDNRLKNDDDIDYDQFYANM